VLSVLKPFGQNTQSERLDLRKRLVTRWPIRQYASERRNLSNPPAIIFPL